MIVRDKLCPDVWRNFPIFLFIKTSTFMKCWGNLQPESNDWLIFRVAKLIFDVLIFMIIFLFVLPIKKQSYIQNNMNLYNGSTTQNKVTELENSDNMNRKREGFDGISESIYLFIYFVYTALFLHLPKSFRGAQRRNLFWNGIKSKFY